MTECTGTADTKTKVIEKYSTSFIPESERHGKIRDLFTLWFTTNIAPLPIVTGALLLTRSHLSFFCCATAIIAGHIVGATVLGACSAQGPRVGLAQMVQARGQFGRYGSVIITLISSILYFGFFTSNTVLSGQALNRIAPMFDERIETVVAAISAVLIGILGYNTIHFLNRYGIWCMVAALVASFCAILPHTPATVWAVGHFSMWGWFLTFTTALVWNTSYACYTSDYSRYLPRDVGLYGPFKVSFLGASIGASVSFTFGAFIASSLPSIADPLSALSNVSGGLALPILLMFVLNIISHNALNAYGAALSVITLIQVYHANWTPGRNIRIYISSIILIIGLVLSILFAESAVPVFLDIVLTLLIALVPWVTINIIDFYVLKRGDYDIQSFFRADGGQYGLVQWPAVTAFAAGVLIQIPFASNAFFTGPFSTLLGGIDFGWLVSPIVTAAVFYFFRRDCAARTTKAGVSKITQ